MNRPIKIAPSLLAADFAHLADEVRRVEKAGCDLLHIDVMDGHFVPNITVGPFIVKAIRGLTRLPLDVHLMIERPERYIQSFTEAGADHITFHAEACYGNLHECVEIVHSLHVTCGISLKPNTPLSRIEDHLKDLNLVLLMTVNPGFGGQKFMPEVLDKVRNLRSKFDGDIQVDGGINKDTAREAIKAGANVLVAGSAIFARADTEQAIRDLRPKK
ncbi:MAG: ribulose-phosphate 3-epimerase [Omnitrophica bacterium RIFCSPHIGHO2_02_FULL_51_18]|nr:MAG: ribulose-phosphate 3-epimerase [Omnitrophica bacterium RIFCSPHIGHO2_02_FULL_51_18]